MTQEENREGRGQTHYQILSSVGLPRHCHEAPPFPSPASFHRLVPLPGAYVCMHAWMYVFCVGVMDVRMYVCMPQKPRLTCRVRMYVYVYVCMHVCMYVSTMSSKRVCDVFTFLYSCVYKWLYSFIYLYIHGVYIYIYAYVHICCECVAQHVT